MGDKLHRREGNNPDHQLRPLNDRSVIKEMNGAKRSAEDHKRKKKLEVRGIEPRASRMRSERSTI
ncbi:hypothetical protein LINGRAHAP2_LOCUS26049 [Linum grandiflorum]